MKLWIQNEKKFYPVTFEQAKMILVSGLSWKQWTTKSIQMYITTQND